MKPLLPALFLGLGLSTATTTPAAAYPVDCAILLCLAGGWPVSAECGHSHAVFIRRITPWPIEPPLQIWNCPMRVGLRGEQRPTERLYDIVFRADLPPAALSLPVVPASPILVDAQADVDISDPAFDFVRSIRVFHIERATQYWRGGNNDVCHQAQSVQLGSYGVQGDFIWQRSDVGAVPTAFDGLQGWRGSHAYDSASCPRLNQRAVFVEWRDHEGNYGFEQVNY
ncbi:hypothetical protein [Pseudotabrizicola sp. 4114]|uniref:hypothetical protein n=1 Tax=Pseudotabrizicola sp. 4114 TaxID=2817731 RepID=UPI002857AF25|nr:hypothetical protein [Pseudorhodobacter sp. 4114]